MDSGRRFRAPRRTPQLIFLAAANLVALGILLYMLGSGGATAAAEDQGGAAVAADAVEAGPLPPAERAAEGRTTIDRALQRRIESAIAAAVRDGGARSKGRVTSASSAVAVHVVELESGLERVAIQPDLALRPASNMKLVTAAAALVLLGVDWHFETVFEAAGTLADGTLEGDLVARAAGDPLFRHDGDGGLDPWLDALARELGAAGIERVSGALVLDEAGFAIPGPGPGWPNAADHWQEYCALSGGFSANAGCITAEVRPGAGGGAARVRVRPRNHGLQRKGTVSTSARRSRLNLAVEARSRGLTVRGTIPADVTTYQTRFAYPDPVELFGHAVVGGLARRGLSIEGGFRRQRDAPGGAAVARLRSPLEPLLVPILEHSNNSVSDQLFLALGHATQERGDRTGGAAASALALERLGISTQGFAQVDGSGLSRENRVSPRQLTALLGAVQRGDPAAARALREALPLAGESGGLEGRMQRDPARGRVRAKTGFIGGTSGLSGVVETLDGRTLCFSILVSYPRVDGLNTHVWKPLQDRICELLVESEGRE